MTSAIPVQCSTNWAIKPTESWPLLWVRNIPVEGYTNNWTTKLYSTGILRTHKKTAPSWLESSVGRALHWLRRGHGFESRSGLIFFSTTSYKLRLCMTVMINHVFPSFSAHQRTTNNNITNYNMLKWENNFLWLFSVYPKIPVRI